MSLGSKSHDSEGVRLVTEESRKRLSERQTVDYRSHRERLVKWMRNVGKNPEKAQGYAYETVRRRADNLDMIYRWVWDQEDGYTTTVTHTHADDYTRELAYSDYSNTHKSNLVKTLKMHFRWREWEFGGETWEPPLQFAQTDKSTQPRDHLTRSERRQIREAALEYGSVPHYNALGPEDRREWKIHLSRRFGKPLDEVGKADFERANGFKIPSLVWASLDAGLRPIEVGRAKTTWVDVENAVLRIPAEDAAKSDESWTVSLQEGTAEMLEKWMDQRLLYEKYDETDKLWLTREGNPYRSTALKYVLEKLCDVAGIPTENRQMTWYAIRHSTGTYLAREDGLAAAQAQLRHRSTRTTVKYDNTPVEDRRDALNRMG